MTWNNCREGTTPYTAPSWAPQASWPHAGVQLTCLLLYSARVLVFPLRALVALTCVLELFTYGLQLSFHVSMLHLELLFKIVLASSHPEAFSFVFTNHLWTSCSDGTYVDSVRNIYGAWAACVKRSWLAQLRFLGM